MILWRLGDCTDFQESLGKMAALEIIWCQFGVYVWP